MTPLRQQMITAMPMHGCSPRTHASYLAAVRDLAKFTRRSPDTLAHADLTRYFEHRVRQRGLAPASVRLFYNGIRFFSLQVFGWPTVDLEVALPKRPQRIPELLTRGAVAAILAACDHARYRTLLTVCYGGGLRLSEVLALRVKDIDGERRPQRCTARTHVLAEGLRRRQAPGRRDHGGWDSWPAPRLCHPSIGGRFGGGAPATPDGPSPHPDHPALCALAAQCP